MPTARPIPLCVAGGCSSPMPTRLQSIGCVRMLLCASSAVVAPDGALVVVERMVVLKNEGTSESEDSYGQPDVSSGRDGGRLLAKRKAPSRPCSLIFGILPGILRLEEISPIEVGQLGWTHLAEVVPARRYCHSRSPHRWLICLTPLQRVRHHLGEAHRMARCNCRCQFTRVELAARGRYTLLPVC
jgi:hypothetical protein